MVMMMAMTPSLNASNLLFPISCLTALPPRRAPDPDRLPETVVFTFTYRFETVFRYLANQLFRNWLVVR